MTHKKFHRIRWICLICSTAIVFALIICGIIAILNAGSLSVIKKAVPVIIVAGIVAFILFLLFGRIFCGFFCPIGLFQDIIWKLTEKFHLPKLSRNEKFMKVMNIFNRIFLCFFIAGIISAIVIIVFFPELLSKISIPLFVPVIIAFFMIILNSFARRLFCNVCPIGSFIGIFERLNFIKLKKDCGSCTMCGACYEACPMKIKSVYTETEKTDISNSKCLYCGECIKKCPNDKALSIDIFGKTVYKSSNEDFLNNQFADITIKIKDKK